MDAFVKLIRAAGTAPASAAVSAKRQSKAEKKKANESTIQRIRIRIGASIGQAFASTLSIQRKNGGKRRRSADDGSISSVDDSSCSSISSRRRKTSIRSVASVDGSLESIEQTPRRGSKKKRSKTHLNSAPLSARSAPSSILVHKGSGTSAQSRQEYHLPTTTTDFVGWRRLHLHELACLKNGDSFMLIIPGDARREAESLKRIRADLRFRLIRHVKPFFERETLGVASDQANGAKNAIDTDHAPDGIARQRLLAYP